ncbi:MAG: peptidase M14 [Chlorobi bacterium]|nr:peptidase M14 [Chlorobiota bacterium]
MSEFAHQLFADYEIYKEQRLLNRRFKHKDILPLSENRKSNILTIYDTAYSFENRKIHTLKAGNGKKHVLLWSQMHGDESTATAALFDIFNFLENPGNLKTRCETILKNCTLFFIPMLNPDGAERFQRRNAQGTDINRDALRLSSPEGRFLARQRDKINPEFGFNLHDQESRYAAGNTKYPATMSFLAPAFDKAKTLNESRKKSMKLIAEINESLQNFIPNQIGRYSDDFMPAAFGDNIQKKGTSTILTESGWFAGDNEKQFVRKLNFTAILHALYSISVNNFEKYSVSDYEKIPFNKKNKFFDYILRNVLIRKNKFSYIVDIGILRKSLPEKDVFEVADIGDLSEYYAYKEKNLENKETEIKEVTGDNAEELIKRFF